MTTQVQQLTLGGFDLFGDGDTWRCETLADGTDLSGNPQPVDVAIQSLIQDGSVSFTEKYDNATVTVVVCLSAADAEALDDGAAALFAELAKPNVLTYEGPLAFGAVAWDVVNSRLDRTADDLGEIRGDRFYTVTLTVLPFRRATEETITPALAASGGTTTNVDSGSSVTGWSAKVDGVSVTPTVVSGAVQAATPAPDTGFTTIVVARTGSAIDTSTTKYLAIDWAATGTTFLTMTVMADGVSLSKIAQAASPVAGYTRHYYYVAASSVTTLTWTVVVFNAAPGATTRAFAVDNIDRTNVAPGSPRQRIRTITVGGSVRTPGTIAVEHETSALGDVFACFWPDDDSGFVPMVRQYRVGGGTPTPESAAVTGFFDDIKATPSVFDVPAGRLPADTYRVYARLAAFTSASAVVTVAFTTRLNGVDVGPVLTFSRTVSLTGQYGIVCLGSLELPTRDLVLPSPLGAARMTISATSSAADVRLDDAWLAGDRGQEFLVSLGTATPTAGGSSNRLWLDAPNLSCPRPRMLVGHAADRSDAAFPVTVGAWKFPEFKPPRVNVLTVTTGADNASVSFRHYERKAG